MTDRTYHSIAEALTAAAAFGGNADLEGLMADQDGDESPEGRPRIEDVDELPLEIIPTKPRETPDQQRNRGLANFVALFPPQPGL